MEQVAGFNTQHQTDATVTPSAHLTVLSTPAENEAPVACSIQSIEGTRMQVRVAQPVAPDAALRVESHDSLWLGTAEACVGVRDDFLLTLRLSHCLRNLPELARLAERFRGRSARPESVLGSIDWNA